MMVNNKHKLLTINKSMVIFKLEHVILGKEEIS